MVQNSTEETWGWQVAWPYLKCGNSVVEGFRDQERRGLMGESGGVGEAEDPARRRWERRIHIYRLRNVCANLGIIHFGSNL